ncbi:transposase, partial [Pseudomonas sp. 2995-3]|uniref:transposase n=1 Tax=Pseudomonas sp. 2995-3 TaxID=1712680 RepID=UPI00117BD58C
DKKIKRVVDFSFINTLLEDTYCKNFGRPAKEPELMCKLLFLQHLYNLSDENVIAESSLNLAHMYFLGLNPEDSLPDKSLLSKFRTQRLGESTLDEMITEIVRQ